MKILPFCAIVAGLALAASAWAQSPAGYLLGTSVPVAAATRTITVTPDARWINVGHGESVRFVIGSTEFAWRFDGPGARSFDLQSVAPAGMLGRALTVYVAAGAGHKP